MVGRESEKTMHEEGVLEGFLRDRIAPSLPCLVNARHTEMCVRGVVVHELQIVHPQRVGPILRPTPATGAWRGRNGVGGRGRGWIGRGSLRRSSILIRRVRLDQQLLGIEQAAIEAVLDA